MKFNKEYFNYWKNRVNNSVDGTEIPSELVFKSFIEKTKLAKNSVCLDLGCGFGRFFPFLSEISNNIHGADISQSMLDDAKLDHNYKSLNKCDSKKTLFHNNFFDFVFCAGLFDVIDQEETLIEINRILKKKGKVIFTGKNINYSEEDNLALRAEKNCHLKDFRLSFTDIELLIKKLSTYGFRLSLKSYFKKRGDFANNISAVSTDNFYEYLVLFEKTTDFAGDIPFKFSHHQSKTINKLFNHSKFLSFEEFCKS